MRASQLPPWTEVHIITEWPEVDLYYKDQVALTSAYFLNEKDHITVDILGHEDLTLPYLHPFFKSGMNQAFFVAPGDGESLETIHEFFTLPEGLPSPYTDVAPDEQYLLYYIPGT